MIPSEFQDHNLFFKAKKNGPRHRVFYFTRGLEPDFNASVCFPGRENFQKLCKNFTEMRLIFKKFNAEKLHNNALIYALKIVETLHEMR